MIRKGTMTVAQYRAATGQPPKANDAPKRRAHGEEDLQAAIVAWCGYSLRSDVRFTHAANERRDVVEAKRQKRAGVLPGWPDLTFVWSDPSDYRPGEYTSRVAFIEVKTPTGSLSIAQRDFRDFCLTAGIPWALVRTLDQAIEQVTEWGLTKGVR